MNVEYSPEQEQIEPLSQPQPQPPETEPQRVATKFVDIDKWVKEQDDSAEAATAAATAASAAEKDSKKQIEDEKYVRSPATSLPGPIAGAESVVPSEVVSRPAAAVLLGEVNWVGKLHEYRAVKPSPVPLSFVESSHSFGFSCTIVLPESSNHFGGPEKRFLRKKDAKQNAARDAITWLAENGHINADYSLRKDKSPTAASPVPAPSSAPRGAATSSSVPNPPGSPPSSYAQLIPGLCSQLGFSHPTYMMATAPNSTAIYSGYAYFPGDPRIVGHVGEFTNVYGKKNAKEVCAKEVFCFLKDIERQRTEQYQEATTGKRKRDRGDVLELSQEQQEDARSNKTLVLNNSQES